MESTPPDAPGLEPEDRRKLRKKHKKVRSAWIAFVGRIVAQFVGSAATIVLGLMLLHKYQPVPTGTATATAAETATTAVTTAFQSHDQRNSVAVLPLRSFSRERADTDIADSMTDVVTAALADIAGLRVVPPTALYSTGESRSSALATRSLAARYVLDGSVTHADDRFRVIVRLVDAERDEQVWTGRYDRPTRNMFKMQDEIAAELIRDVRAVMSDREEGSDPTTWASHGASRLPLPLLK